MTKTERAAELIAFLEWLDDACGLSLCSVGYAGEMLPSGSEHERLAAVFLEHAAANAAGKTHYPTPEEVRSWCAGLDDVPLKPPS